MLSKYCKVFMPFVEGICSVFEYKSTVEQAKPSKAGNT
jgi:hypothetical protein